MYNSVQYPGRRKQQTLKRVTHARAQASINWVRHVTRRLATHTSLIQCLPGTVGTEGKTRSPSFTVLAGDDILWRLLVYSCFFKVRYSLLKRSESKHYCQVTDRNERGNTFDTQTWFSFQFGRPHNTLRFSTLGVIILECLITSIENHTILGNVSVWPHSLRLCLFLTKCVRLEDKNCLFFLVNVDAKEEKSFR